MASEWILAVDQGTTNTKALLFDREGKAKFKASRSVALLQPQPGYVEQDPVAIWRSVRSVMLDGVAFARQNGAQIAGIAISNQRETAVAWRTESVAPDTAGTPVSNAISWQCRRSAEVCSDFAGSASFIQDRSGLPLDPLLTATKWAWLLKAQPALRAEMEAGNVLLGTIDSWLLYNLTGGKDHATDATNASRTGLMNLIALNWDKDLLELFAIPASALPKIIASSSVFGECSAIPELKGVPVVSLVGDSHAALVGHGCYESGSVKATYGTGSSLMMLTTGLSQPQATLARTVAWSMPGKVQYALEGNIAMSGAALQWVGEFLGLANPAEDAAALADSVQSAEGVVLVPAMVGLGAPYWDSSARGLIANLERTHTAAHLARAAIDAIAMQVADVLEAMELSSGQAIPLLMADGGATRNRTLMQLQADLLNKKIRRSAQEELSARGAALLGGLALGWWSGLDALAALHEPCDWFDPVLSETERLELRQRWRLAIERARMH